MFIGLFKYSYRVQSTVIFLRNIHSWPILKNPFQGLEYSKPEKTADILRRHHCFPRKMTSEEQVAASDWLKPISLAARPVGSTSQLWVVTCHQYEFLRSFLRRNFEGKPMVASCFSGCKTPWKISFSTYS